MVTGSVSFVMLETLAFKHHNSKQALNGGIKIMDQNKHISGHFEIMFTWSVL
jgi:hypothetical protein